MSEHSIEELKRQYESAVSRANQALMEKRQAAERYTEKVIEEKLAEFAARGITPGSKVRITGKEWGKTIFAEAGFLGVYSSYPGHVSAIFSRLKKDGTPSKSKWSIHVEEVEPLHDPAQDSLPSQENAA